jgi:hypothetical protein
MHPLDSDRTLTEFLIQGEPDLSHAARAEQPDLPIPATEINH